MGNIVVLVCAQYSTVIYFQHFEQPGASVLTMAHYRRKSLCSVDDSTGTGPGNCQQLFL